MARMNTHVGCQADHVSLTQFIKLIKTFENESDVDFAIHLVDQRVVQIGKSFNIKNCLRMVKHYNTFTIHSDSIDFLIHDQDDVKLYQYMLYNLIYLEIANQFSDRMKEEIYDRIASTTAKYYKMQCYQSSL